MPKTPHPERLEIIEQIVKKYNHDWGRALEEHPEWSDVLQYETKKGRTFAYNTASRFALRGSFSTAYRRKNKMSLGAAMALPTIPAPAPPAPIAAPTATTPTLSRNALIEKVIEGYTSQGQTLWRRAFQEHPDWKEQLGLKTSNDSIMKGLYPAASYMIKTNPKFAHLRKQPKPHYKPRENGEPETEAAAPPPDPIRHCPNCGFNLGIFKAALQVAMKHSRHTK